MMQLKKHISFLFLLSITSACLSQTAFHNTGNVQLHTDAKIGFHTNVINEGSLDNNIGFAGFYADNEVRIISGSKRISFFNVEIDVVNNLELKNSLAVRNQLEFINGTLITPRNNTDIELQFIDYDFYAGEDDMRHINGYTSIKGAGTNDFTFPIGDGDLLRPMRISNQSNTDTFKCAYFYDDPNTPTNFSTSFLTNQKQLMLENISNVEFWDLNGDKETSVTLTWNERSDISAITHNIDYLTVVGWNIDENRWDNLNTLNVTGDIDNGEITSTAFIPNKYEVITIGAVINDAIEDNILISPNGDNRNEFLVLDDVNKFTNNTLVIFNRWGNIIYETKDYKNNWNGNLCEGRATFKKSDKLPNGTYFYVLNSGNTPNKLCKRTKGWVYIHR